jgi:hypothetical protein
MNLGPGGMHIPAGVHQQQLGLPQPTVGKKRRRGVGVTTNRVNAKYATEKSRGLYQHQESLRYYVLTASYNTRGLYQHQESLRSDMCAHCVLTACAHYVLTMRSP